MTFEITDELVEHCAKNQYAGVRNWTYDPAWHQLTETGRNDLRADVINVLTPAIDFLKAKDIAPAENSEAAPPEAQIEAWMRLISAHWDGKYRGAWERKRDLQEEITLVALDVEACGQAKDAANLLLSHHFPAPF
jgi:hypothetical protein